jgi:hypothetical protein
VYETHDTDVFVVFCGFFLRRPAPPEPDPAEVERAKKRRKAQQRAKGKQAGAEEGTEEEEAPKEKPGPIFSARPVAPESTMPEYARHADKPPLATALIAHERCVRSLHSCKEERTCC